LKRATSGLGKADCTESEMYLKKKNGDRKWTEIDMKVGELQHKENKLKG